MSDILVKRLRDGDDLITALSAENKRLNRRIEELEAKIDRCGVKHPQDIKTAGSEISKPTSTGDQVPHLTSSDHELETDRLRGIQSFCDVLQADFQEHKSQMAEALKYQRRDIRGLAQTVASIQRHIAQVEARIQSTSPKDACPSSSHEEATDQTQAAPSEGTTGPRPLIGQWRESEPVAEIYRATGWATQSRSGQERRHTRSSVEDGKYIAYRWEPNRFGIDRRQSARRLSDRPTSEQ